MSGLDLFAWIVLVILLVTLVVVFCLLGALPGHIAKSRGHPWADAVRVAGWLPGHIAKSRKHPYAQAVTVAGWVTLFFGFALWPIALIWAYVDVPAPRKPGDA